MSRQNKKERQRLKRKRKQTQLRKERNTSVFRKIAQRPGPIEVYINADWRRMGEASIMALRDAPGGTRLFAAFLVDLWCSGLKDAFGRSDVTRDEFLDRINDAADRGVDMIPIDPPTAQRLVAGAMRLSGENGFRLPHRADRWASVIGVTSYADADLSDFEKPGGKYRYVGSMPDLRKRLVGSIGQFLKRADIEFVIGSSPLDYLDEDYDEEVADDFGDDEMNDLNESHPPPEFVEQIDEIRDRAYVAIHNWLLGAGQIPHPRLQDGIDVALTAAILESTARENPDGRAAMPSFEDALTRYDDPDAMVAAIRQVKQFMEQFETPERMLEAFGLGGDDPGIEEDAPIPLFPK